MLFSDPSPNREYLPQADSNRELQERSLRALRNALPPQDFVLRDERIEDAGVDVSLELLIQERYTNLRSQVQMKSTGSPRDMADGTVSYSVPVSNLEYLLNGTHSPLYVLYIASRDELRFVWAREEKSRLDRESPGWEQQQSVTLHFRRLLDAQALPEIRDGIEREARLQRQIHEVMGRSAASEVVRVCIESGTLRSTDPEQQKQLILKQGITLVNAGRAAEIIEAAGALNPENVKHGRIQLVLGYAYYVQSQFTLAVAALSQATLRNGDLDEDDRQFMACLRDTCDYYTGRFTFEIFAQRVEAWRQDTAMGRSFAVGFQLDKLRYRLSSVADQFSARESYDVIEARRSIVGEIREYVHGLKEDNDISSLLQFQAFAFWIHAEGTQVVIEDKLRWSKAAMRQKMKQDPKLEIVLQESMSVWKQWYSLVEGALRSARAFGHPLPLADLILSRATVQHLHLLNSHLMAVIFGWEKTAGSADQFNQLYEQLTQAQETFAQIDFLEGQLQCRLTAAQLRVIQGQTEEARREAAEILPIAQAMQYPLLETQARQLLEGKTVLENAQNYALDYPKIDEDERLAEETDLGLRQFAQQQLSNLELPAERLPVLEREAFAMRYVARERLTWCRHLTLIQDKTHARSLETLLATDPFHSARCERFGFSLLFECTDPKIALSSFQYSACKGCPVRSPKGSSLSS